MRHIYYMGTFRYLLPIAACLAGISTDALAQAAIAGSAARTADTSPIASNFVLHNGLKVVIRRDPRLPIVTAIVIYGVGSKDEKPGQFGYAHLFEHLMLDGSAHWDENAFKALSDLGASDTNATTTQDSTIFYETVPRAALERTLFLEADRMGYLAEALTPATVLKEVGVVLNEKRLRGDAPYGGDRDVIAADMYPADHPYHHGVIGTEADLRAITVKDAADWFTAFYGPANATLILTGDIAPDEARTLVEKYFAGLVPRTPVDRLLTRVMSLPGAIRREIYAPVPMARIYATCAAPPSGSPEIAHLDIIAQLMANGATSRLTKRLVDELGIAEQAMVTFDERLLSSEMGFAVDIKSPDKVGRAEAEIDAEIARFVADGPTADELDRAREARIGFIRSSQETTFGKAFTLMRGASKTNDPDYTATYIRQLREATPESIRRTAALVYGKPGHHLIVRPMPNGHAVAGGYDLGKGPPPMGPVKEIAFPAIERARLANGLEIVLVPRRGVSMIDMRLRFDAGAASASRTVASLAMALLGGAPGTAEGNAIDARAEALGGQINASASRDYSDLTLSMDATKLKGGIALLGDLVTRPKYSAATLTALRDSRTSELRGEHTRANASGLRAINNAVYGAAHPYGANSDPADDVRALAAVDLTTVEAWDRAHLRPDRARLYVAGDTDMATLRAMLGTALGGWATGGGACVADPTIPVIAPTTAPTLTIIDKPGATQSFIIAGRLLPPTSPTDDAALEAANEVYGGNFTSRIGTNLRQQRGWTYGIGSGTSDALGQRIWQIAGSVERDHTGESIAELLREMREMNGTRPPAQAELDRIANASINRVAARLEGNGDLLQAIADSESFGRPYDAIVRDPTRLRALTVAQVSDAARKLADPLQMHWVVVGDWNRIRGQLTGLGLGTPVVRRAE